MPVSSGPFFSGPLQSSVSSSSAVNTSSLRPSDCATISLPNLIRTIKPSSSPSPASEASLIGEYQQPLQEKFTFEQSAQDSKRKKKSLESFRKVWCLDCKERDTFSCNQWIER